MEHRVLGRQGLSVSAPGLGSMGMSGFHETSDGREGIDTVRHAVDLGIYFPDASDMYGPLTGRFRSTDDFEKTDSRRNLKALEIVSDREEPGILDEAAPKGAGHYNRCPDMAGHVNL